MRLYDMRPLYVPFYRECIIKLSRLLLHYSCVSSILEEVIFSRGHLPINTPHKCIGGQKSHRTC